LLMTRLLLKAVIRSDNANKTFLIPRYHGRYMQTESSGFVAVHTKLHVGKQLTEDFMYFYVNN